MNLIILIAILLSFISVNFIYSLNSWFDAGVDKINKPNRPIPSGLISKKQALIYSIILGIISIIYPFILFYSSNFKFIFFIFPLIGILYSNKIFSFKKNKYLSIMLITVNALVVVFTGYIINGGNIKSNHDIIILLLIFLFACFGIIPLKDITDIKGDKENNLDNWLITNKQKNIIRFSIVMCVVSLFLAFFINNIYLSLFFIINLSSVIILFIVFLIWKISFNKFYNTLLRVFILDFILELMIFLFLYFLKKI